MFNIIKYLKKKWNLYTGNRYWYRVKFVYKTKGLKQLFSYFMFIGLVEKNAILSERNLKLNSNIMFKNLAIKKLLCNGIYSVEDINYLGYFKNKKGRNL